MIFDHKNYTVKVPEETDNGGVQHGNMRFFNLKAGKMDLALFLYSSKQLHS